MNSNDLVDFRADKDAFFKTQPESPLTAQQRGLFKGLSYYEPDEALDLTVTVTPFAQPETVQIQTTTGDVQTYRRYGEFTFEVAGTTARLTIFASPHGFFLPFVDTNAGVETYPAGRYLEPEFLSENRFRVNFNLAYNPFCAYSDAWSCPITPPENRLKVAIRAGEKLPEGDWVGLG